MKKNYNYKDVTEPKSGWVVLRDHYWICKDGDPTHALFFNNIPQCNLNEKIVNGKCGINRKDLNDVSNLSVVYIDIAYVPNIQ